MRRISMTTRDELIEATAARYALASRAQRGRILDEFTAVTGFHRKHASRLLRLGKPMHRSAPRLARRIYDEAMREAVVLLWESSDRVCGKRLRAMLPLLVSAMERNGHINLAAEVRDGVLSMSAATIDRILGSVRSGGATGRVKRASPSAAVKRAVRVRTFSDWGDPAPGFFEADLVAHSGPSAEGSFVQTLTLTDIASGWTEFAPLLVREQHLLTEVLDIMRQQIPMPILGLDTDNDSVFMNETLLAWCAQGGVEFTRCRPYRKNDQAWVEQKNGAVVRRLVGYRRYEGIEAAELLGKLYGLARLFVNVFQPSFKLASKQRDGARVARKYFPPATPCRRLMAHPSTSEATKERLLALEASLDPIDLLARMRDLQTRLADLADGVASNAAKQAESLETFLSGLRMAWKDGEARPTATPKPRPPRDWRTRIDPFAAVADDLDRRFLGSPASTGRDIFQSLQAEYPGVYPDKLLRTFQRRLKAWRREHAKALVFGGGANERLHAEDAPLQQAAGGLSSHGEHFGEPVVPVQDGCATASGGASIRSRPGQERTGLADHSAIR